MPPRRDRREAGFTLLEVLVAMFIVALAVFPMLELIGRAEVAAKDARYTSLACDKIRALLSSIAGTAAPGDFGEGDLSMLTDEEGYDARTAYTNIYYEWTVAAVDLSSDLIPETDPEEGAEEDEERSFEERLEEEGETDDLTTEERYRARYVRVSVFYELDSGEQKELLVETFLPPLPREEDAYQRLTDPVPPNRGQ